MTRFARLQRELRLAHRLTSHESLLMRKLGDTDIRLQANKIINLRIASAKLDGLIIRPGETFSFWKSVGRPSRRRGYVAGMLLSDGRVREGVGGGLCQMANLLFWMALHSPLAVTERHHHSLDVFPDSGRTLPFGSGASVFFNYIDLRFRNDTSSHFQIGVGLDADHLRGELRSEALPAVTYHVAERDHRFYKDEAGEWRRENRLYRTLIDRRSGVAVGEELIEHHLARVLYAMQDPAHQLPDGTRISS